MTQPDQDENSQRWLNMEPFVVKTSHDATDPKERKRRVEDQATELAKRNMGIAELAFEVEGLWKPFGPTGGFNALILNRDTVFAEWPTFENGPDFLSSEFSKNGLLTGRAVGVDTDTYVAADFLTHDWKNMGEPELGVGEKRYFFVDLKGEAVELLPVKGESRSRSFFILEVDGKKMTPRPMQLEYFKAVNIVLDTFEQKLEGLRAHYKANS